MKWGNYRFGSIKIDGKAYEKDVILDEGALRKREKMSDSVSEGATISVQWEPPDRLRRESFEGARKEG